MDKIVSEFKPWLDADPDLDICRSDKFGWVCIDRMSVDNVEVFCQFPEDPQQLLVVQECGLAQGIRDRINGSIFAAITACPASLG